MEREEGPTSRDTKERPRSSNSVLAQIGLSGFGVTGRILTLRPSTRRHGPVRGIRYQSRSDEPFGVVAPNQRPQ